MRGSNRSVLAAVMVLAAASFCDDSSVAAEVTRCTDAAGKVSYTDKACPSNTRQAKQLEGIESNGTSVPVPALTTLPGSAPARSATTPPARAETPRQRNQVPAGSGLIVIDPRARNPSQEPPVHDASYPDAYPDSYPYAGYPDAGYPNAYRRNRSSPQNLSPTLRNCDAGGCSDTIGNHYDRTGKVDRYVRPDGRTCRPVGTTVVC